MRRLNIMHVIPDLERTGGAQQLLYNYVQRFDKDIFHPYICTLCHSGSLRDEIRSLGIEVISLFQISGHLFLPAVWRLKQIFVRKKIDIVFAWDSPANSFAIAAGYLSRVPILISSIHNMHIWKPEWMLKADTLCFRLSDRVIAVSEAVRMDAIKAHKISPDKIITIHNGVDHDLYGKEIDRTEKRKHFNLSDNDIVIGNIARIVPVKDQETLIRAMAIVAREFVMAKLLIIGGIPSGWEWYKESLLRLIKEYNLEDNIFFLGERRDVHEILPCLDLFVLSSIIEGLPLTLLEALFAGIPAVVTDAGGNREVVEDQKTGVLVPCKDPEALAKGIIALLKDKELREKLAINGRAKVLRYFSIDQTVYKIQRLCIYLINERNGYGKGTSP